MKQIAIWIGKNSNELDNYLKEGFTVHSMCAQSVAIAIGNVPYSTQKEFGSILVILNTPK